MTGITDLPPETIEEILLHSDPIDIASFAQTSRLFRALIYQAEDQHLWRALYLLQPLDDPRSCWTQDGVKRSEVDIDWRGELQSMIRLRAVLENISFCRGPDERRTILITMLDLVCRVPPLKNLLTLEEVSQNLLWVADMLRGGAFLDQLDLTISDEERQLCARIHTLFGLTSADTNRSKRVESWAYIYDMRNYQWSNEFGPFMMDGSGRVNWRHMQAIHHIMSMHIVDLSEDEEFELEFFPMSLRFTQIVAPEWVVLDRERDWAGVEGLWRCSFCFCDHRELLVYNNFSLPNYQSSEEPLDISIFEDPDFHEEFRIMDVVLNVTESVFDKDHPTRPKIHFAGEIGEHAMMTGWVQMTPDEQIRWHFVRVEFLRAFRLMLIGCFEKVSGDQGRGVWSSEGIQVGGVRSAFGVLGSWTTTMHDVDDPVGPFWLHRMIAYSQPEL